MAENGILAFEVGINQADSVIELADGFNLEEKIKDYNGIERIVILRKKIA